MTSEGRARQAWDAMRTLVLDSHDRRAEVCAALGMSFFRIKVLRRVAAGPVTMSELVERLRSDAPYVSIVVEDLVGRGLVVRTSHPDDRRRKIVSVTQEGAAAAARAEEVLGRPPAALEALPDEELKALEQALARMLKDN